MDRRAFVTGLGSVLAAPPAARAQQASDLPVQWPVLLDFTLNLETAKALNLTIPPSLLLRADQVIE